MSSASAKSGSWRLRLIQREFEVAIREFKAVRREFELDRREAKLSRREWISRMISIPTSVLAAVPLVLSIGETEKDPMKKVQLAGSIHSGPPTIKGNLILRPGEFFVIPDNVDRIFIRPIDDPDDLG